MEVVKEIPIYKEFTINSKPKYDNFKIGDKVDIKGIYSLFYFDEGTVIDILNNGSYKIKYDDDKKKDEILDCHMLKSANPVYRISITPYKNYYDFPNNNSYKFTLFSSGCCFDYDMFGNEYGFYIILNHLDSTWCFIQNNEYRTEVFDELGNSSGIKYDDIHYNDFLNQYFKIITKFKLQDKEILDIIGPLKHSYVETKVSDNEIRYDLRTKENENFD